MAFHACADRCPKCGGDRNPNPKVTNSRVTIIKEKPKWGTNRQRRVGPDQKAAADTRKETSQKDPPSAQTEKGGLALLQKDPKIPLKGIDEGTRRPRPVTELGTTTWRH